MKRVLLFLLVSVLAGVVVLSCSDGKLNLLLFIYGDEEEKEPGEIIEGPIIISSSSEAPLPPPPSSSSSEAPLPISSSSEEPPPLPSCSSSAPEPPPRSSSSNRAVRSSTSEKVNKDSVEYVDYPTIQEGEPGVWKSGKITRYWDACKPSCSWPLNLKQADGSPSPNGIARQCDRNGKEMPLFYRKPPVEPTWAEFLGTPSACDPHDINDWLRSPTYADWKAEHPNFPSGVQAAGYLCVADQIPYAVNDTLAYAFVANSDVNCGKCFMLQFTGNWIYSDASRATHRALEGKTLIVMVNNSGVDETDFDVMIPGGGVGNNANTFTEQTGIPQALLGHPRGGLLAECTFEDFGGTPERYSVEQTQTCLRTKCNRTFANHPDLLKGCLWSADWYMAADNPEVLTKEVDCPKYLIDRYVSTLPLPTRPADLNPNASCNVGGGAWTCPAP